jgi:hypothetical protein
MIRSLAIAAAILLPAFAAFAATPPAAPAAPAATAATAANTISFTGKLTTGMMAIGGETTGTIISDSKTTYELDAKDPALKAKFNQLSNKQVTVTGTLTVRAGIEVGQRRIITVQSLESAPATAPATQTK